MLRVWPFVRVLMGAAILVAALALAPAGAEAHAGHHHAAQPDTAAGPTAAAALEAIGAVWAGLRDEASRKSGSFDASCPGHSPEGAQSCRDGCCHSAASGCCMACLLPPTAFPLPPAGAPAFELAAAGGAGIAPGALPEPPRRLP
jgi:hypothetical protein